MNKINLDIVLNSFLAELEYVNSYMVNTYGNVNFIKEKNLKKIPNRVLDIRNEKLKRFYFHGRGCLFCFKDFSIDTEYSFVFQKFGFNLFNFIEYASLKYNYVNDSLLNDFLNNSNLLDREGNIFVR